MKHITIGSWRISPVVAWYDLWIGAYYDRYRRSLYILPVPMVGIKIEFGCSETMMRALANIILKHGGSNEN